MLVERSSVIEAIQVSYEMSEEKTREREFRGLLNACKEYNLNHGLIITYDEEGIYGQDGVKNIIIEE